MVPLSPPNLVDRHKVDTAISQQRFFPVRVFPSVVFSFFLLFRVCVCVCLVLVLVFTWSVGATGPGAPGEGGGGRCNDVSPDGGGK